MRIETNPMIYSPRPAEIYDRPATQQKAPLSAIHSPTWRCACLICIPNQSYFYNQLCSVKATPNEPRSFCGDHFFILSFHTILSFRFFFSEEYRTYYPLSRDELSYLKIVSYLNTIHLKRRLISLSFEMPFIFFFISLL